MLTLKRRGIAEKDSIVQLSYKETYFLYEGTVMAKNGETLKVISTTFEFSRQKVDTKLLENGTFQSIPNLK